MIYILFPLANLLALLWGDVPAVSRILACGFILYNLGNQQGALMKRLPPFIARSGDRLERSREFLFDLNANRDTCRFVEDSHFKDPILAKWPFSFMLTLPELGYVKDSVPGVIDTDRLLMGSRAPVTPAAAEALRRHPVVIVYAPNVYDIEPGRPSLLPRAGDLFLKEDHSLPGYPVVVYRRDSW
jgi:hypothetical protein